MPLNRKGEKVKEAMEREYGKKKGDSVFYASEKKGTIKGVTKSPRKKDKGLALPLSNPERREER